MNIRISLAALVLAFAFPSLASPARQDKATPPPAVQQQAAPESRPASIENSKSDQEIELLKKQIELIDNYQESLLSIVLWSLGGVVGLALLLSGFSWWTNFRLNENDRKGLLEEMQKITASAKQAAELAAIQTINPIATQIRSDLSALRDRLDSAQEETTKSRAQVNSSFQELAKQILNADVQLRLVEEYVWDTRKNQYNVLLTQAQGANSAFMSGDETQVKLVLERMKSTLEKKVLPSGEKFSQDDVAFIEKWLAKIETNEAVLFAEVRDLLTKSLEAG